jgi:hypothetical protein
MNFFEDQPQGIFVPQIRRIFVMIRMITIWMMIRLEKSITRPHSIAEMKKKMKSQSTSESLSDGRLDE